MRAMRHIIVPNTHTLTAQTHTPSPSIIHNFHLFPTWLKKHHELCSCCSHSDHSLGSCVLHEVRRRCAFSHDDKVCIYFVHIFSLFGCHRLTDEEVSGGESSAASIVPASNIQHQPNKNHRSQLNGTEYVPLYVCICMIYAACLTSMRSKSIINELQCALCIHFKFS